MNTTSHRQIALILVLTAVTAAMLTAGCRSKDVRDREYYGAVETAPLKMPEGLELATSSTALLIESPKIPLSPMAMETKPPRISATTSGLDSNSRFQWSAQGLFLQVEDAAQSVQRRLGLVIERAGMQRIRVDEQGVYRFDYYQQFEEEEGFFRKMAFWSRDNREDYSGAYQLFVRPDGEESRVYVKYADGTDCEPDAAEHLLDVIRGRLG